MATRGAWHGATRLRRRHGGAHNVGLAALVLAFVVGKRIGYGEYNMAPYNIPLMLIGTTLLWFGWFGLNTGSVLAADASAANALLVTHVAASAGALAWLVASWVRDKPGSLGSLAAL